MLTQQKDSLSGEVRISYSILTLFGHVMEYAKWNSTLIHCYTFLSINEFLSGESICASFEYTRTKMEHIKFN